jgi:hypothetical protein
MPRHAANLAILVGLGFVATIVIGVVYVFVQQDLRQGANHPQAEVARAAASRLNGGATPASVVPSGAVDIASSADPYVIVVDARGAVLASSASLGGSAVVPPSGVFDYVRAHGEDTVTWQPATGVRSAIVVDAFDSGFVVAGRSLKGTEDQESSALLWAGLAWAASMLVLSGLAVVRLRG